MKLMQIKEKEMCKELICDKEVSRLIGLSPSWVRVQRMKLRRNEDHLFTVAPVMIGSSPRYRYKDVMAWIEGLD